LEVTHDDGDFSACQNENDKDNEEETKDIVESISPNGSENEEQLNKHGTERQNAAHKNGL
jgi:hypothetical protein